MHGVSRPPESWQRQDGGRLQRLASRLKPTILVVYFNARQQKSVLGTSRAMNKNRPKFSVFGFFAFLVGMQIFLGCNRTPETHPQTQTTNTSALTETNPPPEAKVAEVTNAPIDGLFGIKLGKPLPSEIPIRFSNTNNGLLVLFVTPSQTNAAFESYSVTLTPTNQIVCGISALGSHLLGTQPPVGLVGILVQRYGSQFSQHKDAESVTYWWTQGKRTLTFLWGDLGSSDENWTIICQDDQLYKPVISTTDTNGL
jgi:hypothetical protein